MIPVDGDSQRRSIVVGVSPSTGSPAALRWAAAEARRRNAPLHAVMAWREPRTQGGPGTSPPAFTPSTTDELQVQADARLADAVRIALGDDHRAQCAAVRGGTIKVLLAAAAGAQLLVVDGPRAGAPPALRPGLVASQLAYRASCPVVMVPPSPPRQGSPGKAMTTERRS